MVSLGTATAIALGSCQSVTTNVNAIMKHDDVPQLSREQQNAFSAFESGQFSKAVKLFKQAIAIEPDAGLKATLYNGLGSSHNELNQPTQAIEAYLESLKLNQQNAQVWVNLGIAQRLIGEYDEALKSYRAALKLDSSLATAYSSIGSLRVLKGQPELAIDAFNSAIAIDENLAVTHGNLALAYAMVKQFDQAQQSLKRAIALGYENGDLVQSRINELKPQP
ncbi:MAG: tetratricopeptide repeat protein [Cyanobacteria bacterium P01_F01_bin.42]